VLFSGNVRNELFFTFQKEEQRSGSPAAAPAILVKEAFTGGPSQSFGREKKETFDLADTLTRARGRHSFVFGGRFRKDLVHAVDASNLEGHSNSPAYPCCRRDSLCISSQSGRPEYRICGT